MARPAICVLLVCICCLNVACVASETATSETSSDEQQAEVSLSLPAGGSSLQQQQSPQEALAAHPSAARCLGTKGDWCLAFYSQPSVPWDQLQLHGKTCPNNCSSVGVCHADTGLCDCPAGGCKRDILALDSYMTASGSHADLQILHRAAPAMSCCTANTSTQPCWLPSPSPMLLS